jgi:hypothetical protein
MKKDYSAVNRAKLVDEPIVEMILAHKYSKQNVKFMKADLESDYNGTDIICYSDGVKKSINVKRNSSKHYNSPNFSISINKNNLTMFRNTSFIFIDEVADSLYTVDGTALLSYILNNSNNINTNANKFWVVIPKTDIISMANDMPDGIIHYNKNISKLFELGRDENKYKELL